MKKIFYLILILLLIVFFHYWKNTVAEKKLEKNISILLEESFALTSQNLFLECIQIRKEFKEKFSILDQKMTEKKYQTDSSEAFEYRKNIYKAQEELYKNYENYSKKASTFYENHFRQLLIKLGMNPEEVLEIFIELPEDSFSYYITLNTLIGFNNTSPSSGTKTLQKSIPSESFRCSFDSEIFLQKNIYPQENQKNIYVWTFTKEFRKENQKNIQSKTSISILKK